MSNAIPESISQRLTHEQSVEQFVAAGGVVPYEPKPGERVRIVEIYPHDPYPKTKPGAVEIATYGTEMCVDENWGRKRGWLKLYFETPGKLFESELAYCKVEPVANAQ